MSFDHLFEQNIASSQHIRALAERLSDQALQHQVYEHWTLAIALAHLALCKERVMASG
jgi:hypothetical protein